MHYVTDEATQNRKQKASKMYKLFLLTALAAATEENLTDYFPFSDQS